MQNKLLRFSIFLVISALQSIIASDKVLDISKSKLLNEFSGTRVNCHVGYVSNEISKRFPNPINFKLVSIILKFDDQEAKNFIAQTQQIDPNNLFIISYTIKASQGTLTNYFTLDRKKATLITDGSSEILSYSNNLKSVSLTAHEGFITEKFIFEKNGEKLFTCSHLDIF